MDIHQLHGFLTKVMHHSPRVDKPVKQSKSEQLLSQTNIHTLPNDVKTSIFNSCHSVSKFQQVHKDPLDDDFYTNALKTQFDVVASANVTKKEMYTALCKLQTEEMNKADAVIKPLLKQLDAVDQYSEMLMTLAERYRPEDDDDDDEWDIRHTEFEERHPIEKFDGWKGEYWDDFDILTGKVHEDGRQFLKRVT